MLDLQITKKYTLPKDNLQDVQCRIPIIKNTVELLIYWLPNGLPNCNKPGYFGSIFEVKQLHDNINIQYASNQYIMDIIWKCGSSEKKISQSYVNYKSSLKYGYGYLFEYKLLEKYLHKIKIIINVYKNKNIMKQNYTKTMKQITLKECYIKKMKMNPRQAIFINHLLHHKKKNAPMYFINAKISLNQLYDILQLFAGKLNLQNLFSLIPTIDCFASKQNYQTKCKKYITKEDDFFSITYDDIHFWNDEIAWMFPPLNSKNIQLCLNKIKQRKMRAYLCVPYLPNSYKWYSRIKMFCEEYIEMKGRDKAKDRYIADKSILSRCGFDIIVYYFNYQKCNVCQH